LQVYHVESSTLVNQTENEVVAGDTIVIRFTEASLSSESQPLYKNVRILNRERHLGYGVWNPLTRAWELTLRAPQPEAGWEENTLQSYVSSAQHDIHNGGFETWVDGKPQYWTYITGSGAAVECYQSSGDGSNKSLGVKRLSDGSYGTTLWGMVWLPHVHDIVPGEYYLLSLSAKRISDNSEHHLGVGNGYFRWASLSNETTGVWQTHGPNLYHAGRNTLQVFNVTLSDYQQFPEGVYRNHPHQPDVTFAISPEGSKDTEGNNPSEWLVDNVELKLFTGMVLRAVFADAAGLVKATDTVYVGVERNSQIVWDAPPVILDALTEVNKQLGVVNHQFTQHDWNDLLYDFSTAYYDYSGTGGFSGTGLNPSTLQSFATAFVTNEDDDNSPELRQHHLLDMLVGALNNDPLLIVNFVLNEIELTDPMDFSVAAWGDSLWATGTVYEGGLRRNALTTYLSRKGSPSEQCALLVYLLRHAGYAAAYARVPAGNLKLRKQRASNLVGYDFNKRVDNESEKTLDSSGKTTITATYYGYLDIEEIPFDYPWVVLKINDQLINIFPWLKDYETKTGLELYEYLPKDLNTGDKIAVDYMLKGKYFSGFLASHDNPRPLEVFEEFLDYLVRLNHPQHSLSDFGIHRQIRKRYHSDWTDLPRPDDLVGNIQLNARYLELPTHFEWIELTIGKAAYDTTNGWGLDASVTSPQLRIPLSDFFLRRVWIDMNCGSGNYTPLLKIAPFDFRQANAYTYTTQSGTLDFWVNNQWSTDYQVKIRNSLQWNLPTLSTSQNLYVKVALRRQPRIPLVDLDNEVNIILVSRDHAGKYWFFNQGLYMVTGRVISAARKSALLSCSLGNEAHPDIIQAFHHEYDYRLKVLGDNPSAPDVSIGMTNFLMAKMFQREKTRGFQRLSRLHATNFPKYIGFGLFGFSGKAPEDSDYHPFVSYFYNEYAFIGNLAFSSPITVNIQDQLKNWLEPAAAFRKQMRNCMDLAWVHSSAAEHLILKDIFGDEQSSSTVSIFHQAGSANILKVNKGNLAQIEANGMAAQVQGYSPDLWNSLVKHINEYYWTDCYITKSPITTNALSDVAAMLLTPQGGFASLISRSTQHIPDPPGAGNPPGWYVFQLYGGDSGNVAGILNNEIVGDGESGSKDEDPTTKTKSDQSQMNDVLDAESNTALDQNEVTAANNGNNGSVSTESAENKNTRNFTEGDSVGEKNTADNTQVSDPVHSVTGELYIHALDIRLEGTFPLELRRNYTSLSLVADAFGLGWRTNLVPYLMVNTGNPNDFKSASGKRIRSAEMDGTLVEYNYSHTDGNQYIWNVAVDANKALSNQSLNGIGGRQSVFANQLVFEDLGSVKRFTLHGNNGDKRIFTWRTYTLYGVDYTRPYLDYWEDAHGNRLTFEYYDNYTEHLWQYGKPRRIVASNGNWLHFTYNRAGQIRQVSTGDGRFILYSYDKFGELRRVDLPDGSWEEYDYKLMNSWYLGNDLGQLGTRTDTYSSGLIRQVRKSDDSRLVNFFDDKRRVIAQQATVGNDRNLVANAYFVYSDLDANGVGWTRIYDFRETPSAIEGEVDFADLEVNGWPFAPSAVATDSNCTLYEHRHGLITRITDRLDDTIEYDYYWERTNTYPNSGVMPDTQGYLPDITQSIGADSPAGYPRSLKRKKDKRGLITYYWYDDRGNLILEKVFGDFTGNGSVQARTYRTYYNSDGMPVATQDEARDRVSHTEYDTTYPFLPAIRRGHIGSTITGDPQSGYNVSGGILMSRDDFHYNSRTTFNPAITYVNGLMIRHSARDASDGGNPNKDRIVAKWEYDSRGLPTAHTRFATRGSGTTEPTSPYDQHDLLAYNLRSELERRTRQDGALQHFRYDQAGRPISAIVYESATATTPLTATYTQYDAGGRPRLIDGPQRGAAEDYVFRDYDAAGRLVAEISWLSEAKEDGTGIRPLPGQQFLLGQALTLYEYDPFGNLIKIIDPLGHETVHNYDLLGRRIQTRRYNGHTGELLALEAFTYEPGGNIAAQFNQLEGLTLYTYTSDGQLSKITFPDSTIEQRRYLADGRLDYIVEPGGNRTKFEYNDTQRIITRKVLEAGTLNVLAQQYEKRDVQGNLIEQTDSNGNLWRYTYDGLNRRVLEEGPADTWSASITRAIEYDPAGKWQLTVTSGKEHVLETYDGLGRRVGLNRHAPLSGQTPSKLNNTLGVVYRKTTWRYDVDHHWTLKIEGADDLADANAHISRTFFDTRGREVLSQRIIEHNVTTGCRTITLKNLAGTDWTFGGAVTRSVYDAAGLLRARYVDTDAGTPIQVNRTTWRYDALGRPIREELPDGAVTRFAYDPMGNLTSRMMPRDLVWRARYDKRGRKTEEWLEGQDSTRRERHFTYSYHPASHPHASRLAQRIDHSRQVTTEYLYNSRGWLAEEISTGAGDVWPVRRTWNYDAMGNPLTTQQFHDGKDDPPLWYTGTSIANQYDAYGRRRTETVSRWGFSGWQTHSALDQTWNDHGNRDTLTAPDGSFTFSRSYHNFVGYGYLRNEGVTLNGQNTYETRFAHHGRVWEVVNNLYVHDSAAGSNLSGQLLSRSIKFHGDPGFPGFVNQQVVLSESMSYTLDGRLKTYGTTYQPSGPTNPQRAYTYNKRRQLVDEQWRNSSNASINYMADYRFDGGKLGVLTSRRVRVGSNPEWGWTVPATDLDPFARILGEALDAPPLLAAGVTNGPARVRLELDRLSSPTWTRPVGDVRHPEAANEFEWDADLAGLPAGNYRLRAWAHHPSGAYVAGPDEKTFTVSTQEGSDHIANVYDAQGFLRERHHADGKSQYFEWDALGRVMLVCERDGANNGRNFRFLYDARGRRLALREIPVSNGIPDEPYAFETRSWYDPQTLFMEIRVEQGNEKWWKIYGPDASGTYGGVQGIGGLLGLAKVDGSEQVHVMQDFHGHVIGYTKKVGAGSWTWGGFTEGRRVSGYGPTQDASVKPWKAAGGTGYESELVKAQVWRGYRIESFGYYHMGDRLYDPIGGRFLSPDPYGHAASMDLYNYANGDPVNFVDPTGRGVDDILNAVSYGVENNLVAVGLAGALNFTDKLFQSLGFGAIDLDNSLYLTMEASGQGAHKFLVNPIAAVESFIFADAPGSLTITIGKGVAGQLSITRDHVGNISLTAAYGVGIGFDVGFSPFTSDGISNEILTTTTTFSMKGSAGNLSLSYDSYFKGDTSGNFGTGMQLSGSANGGPLSSSLTGSLSGDMNLISGNAVVSPHLTYKPTNVNTSLSGGAGFFVLTSVRFKPGDNILVLPGNIVKPIGDNPSS
jgi:RHS repeat-associated protein